MQGGKRRFSGALLLAGLILPIQGKAQEHLVPDTEAISNRSFILKWTPTALIDPYSALQVAGELYYTPEHSVQLEYGLMFPAIARAGTRTRGHRIRLEHRVYFGASHRWYYAPELHFISVDYTTAKRFSDSWYTDSVSGNRIPENPYRAEVGVHKTAGSLNHKLGYQYEFPRLKLVLDFYAGLGLRVVNTRFTSYPATGQYVPPIDNFLEPPFKEGTRLALNGVAGIKIGYRFR